MNRFLTDGENIFFKRLNNLRNNFQHFSCSYHLSFDWKCQSIFREMLNKWSFSSFKWIEMLQFYFNIKVKGIHQNHLNNCGPAIFVKSYFYYYRYHHRLLQHHQISFANLFKVPITISKILTYGRVEVHDDGEQERGAISRLCGCGVDPILSLQMTLM